MEIRNYNKIDFYALDLKRYMGKVVNVLCISAVLFMLSGCPSEPGANAGAANPELFGVWKAVSEDPGTGIEPFPLDMINIYYPGSPDTDVDGYEEADITIGVPYGINEEVLFDYWLEITDTQMIPHQLFTVQGVDDNPSVGFHALADWIHYYLAQIELVISITDTIFTTNIEPYSYVVTGDTLTWISDGGTDTMVLQRVDPSEIAGSTEE